MRHVGSLSNERDAQRFAAYLITQGIDAHAEQDTHDWAIWVRDENRIAPARESFELFRIDPQDSRYRSAERDAESIRREKAQRRNEAQKNVVEMRGRWKQPGARRAPLTVTLIILSCIVTLFGNFGQAREGIGVTINAQLLFCDKDDYKESKGNPIASLAKGEVWRVITPIFIHFDWLHIAFNMIMFFRFGALVETLRGTVRLALLVLLIAAISNVAQGVAPEAWGGTPSFGGMSGVVYGLFGYTWLKSVFDPTAGFFLGQGTVIFLLAWLFLCMTPAIPNMANVAHIVGLIVGMTLAYVPVLIKR